MQPRSFPLLSGRVRWEHSHTFHQNKTLFQLCEQIAKERDPKRRAPLVEEMIELLAREQAEIKAQLRARDYSARRSFSEENNSE